MFGLGEKKKRHLLIIDSPDAWSFKDVSRLAAQRIDIIGWDTHRGGRMTPYYDRTVCFIGEQRDQFKKLYKLGQRTFWMGLDDFHHRLFGNNFARVIADTIEEMHEIFCDNYMPYARVGIHIPNLTNFAALKNKVESVTPAGFHKAEWLLLDNTFMRTTNANIIKATMLTSCTTVGISDLFDFIGVDLLDLSKAQQRWWRKQQRIGREGLIITGGMDQKKLNEYGVEYFK